MASLVSPVLSKRTHSSADVLQDLALDPDVGLCRRHSRPISFVCLVDGLRICDECIDHEAHNRRPLRECADLARAHLEVLCEESIWDTTKSWPALDLHSVAQEGDPISRPRSTIVVRADSEVRRLTTSLSRQLEAVSSAAAAARNDLVVLRDTCVAALLSRFSELESQISHAEALKVAALEAEQVAADASLTAIQTEFDFATRIICTDGR